MFYSFGQNNSGGSFDFDEHDGITHWVIVEADSPSDAISRVEAIGLYWDGCNTGKDCPCCGDRWDDYIDDHDGKEVPEIYGEPLTEEYFKKGAGYTWMADGREACVHYKDGRKEWF